MSDDLAAINERLDRVAALEALRLSIWWACRPPTPSIYATALGCSSNQAICAPGLDRHPYPEHALQHDTIMFRTALRLNIIDPLTGHDMAGNA